MRRWCNIVVIVGLGLAAAGCPKGQTAYDQGRKAETAADLDAALTYYQQALKADPQNANFRAKLDQIRFEAGQAHVKKGVELRKKGDLQGAAGEFQRAQAVDPSSPVAEQELRKTMEAIAEANRTQEPGTEAAAETGNELAAAPPVVKPFSRAAINLTATNDAKFIFDTIGKLAGISVIYDPDFPARRIHVELTNVTLEQALEIACLESKAFWKPVTENIIFIIPDQPQKRRDYEEQVVKTFYLSNTVQAQDLTEIVTGLRQLLELKRIQQLNSQNAIMVRDTPDKLAIAGKMINDIDKAKPEVVVQIEVLQARTDRLRTLGILPGQTAALTFTPPTTTTTSNSGSGSTSTPTNILPLDQLKHLATKDFSITLPGATANAVMTDTYTKIIQNPEIRSIDGQPAKLRIGDKIPIATGSFQAGVGVGSAGAGGFVNPLVNTQFQYQDVGVNVDMTPRVHPNHEISLKLMIEVSSVTGQSTIGGIQQPIISQRKIEHDIRLKEGEVNILGGLFDRTDTRTLNGWPGLGKIPLLRYLFSSDNIDHQEDEVLIVLIPHIVRLPEWTKANLTPVFTGSESNVQVKRASDVRSPVTQAPAAVPPAAAPANAAPAPAANLPAAAAADQSGQPAKLRFQPATLTLKPGETVTLGIVVDGVTDLYSIPMLLQYNPAVISLEEVQHAQGQGGQGGFLSGGNQEIAIVQQINKERGQAIISATRQPNTPGVSGSGTLLGIKIKGVSAGSSNLTIVQVNAKDSQQRPIQLVTSEAVIQVQP